MSSMQGALQTLQNRGPIVTSVAIFHDVLCKFQKSCLGLRYFKRLVNNSYRMYLDTADTGISRSLILFGTREVDHKIILEDFLKPGMTIYDIGANIGYYVLMETAAIKRNGKIIAIEPSPQNVELLKRNLELNAVSSDLVTVINAGISDKTGIASFHLAHQSNLHTFHPKGSAAAHLSGTVIDVETYSIPDLVQKYGPPDLIRMDVEGHELEIIIGMLEDIEAGAYKPAICFEPHISCYNKDHDFAPVLERLFAAGYITKQLSSNAQSGTERIQSLGYSPSTYVDSDGEKKAIFENISAADTVKILTQTGGARTVLLTPS